MAVNRVGTQQTVTDTDTSISESVTIHADSKICVLLAAGWRNATNWLDPSDFTLGGQAFSDLVDTDSQSSNGQVWIGYLVSPPTGSQTFAGTIGSAPTNGNIYVLLGYDEVDTGDPFTDSDTATGGGDITGLTTGASDMTVGIACRDTTNPTVSDNSQTVITTGTFDTEGYGVAQKANATGWYYSNPYYSTCAAAVLKYGIAAGVVLPPFTYYYNKRRTT